MAMPVRDNTENHNHRSFVSEAAYRFYRTKCEENSAKKNGKDGAKKLMKRRHERTVRVMCLELIIILWQCQTVIHNLLVYSCLFVSGIRLLLAVY